MNSVILTDKGKNSDYEKFDQLVKRFGESLNAFACRITNDREAAGDIVQTVFANLWMNRKKIDFENSIDRYLYVSARNLSYKYLNSRKRLNDQLPDIAESDEQSVTNHLIREETIRLLMEAIDQLPPRTAEVILLGMEGLKQDEIAEKMNVTVANVKLLKSRGIKKLREILGPLYVLIVYIIN